MGGNLFHAHASETSSDHPYLSLSSRARVFGSARVNCTLPTHTQLFSDQTTTSSRSFFYDSARGDFFYVISIELSVILIWRQYNAGREKNSKIGGNSQSRALDDDINDENWKNFVSVFYEFIIIWRAHHQHICPPFSDAWDRWRW